jgi:hypothetical protein
MLLRRVRGALNVVLAVGGTAVVGAIFVVAYVALG